MKKLAAGALLFLLLPAAALAVQEGVVEEARCFEAIMKRETGSSVRHEFLRGE